MHVLIPLSSPAHTAYTDAARLLRRALGDRAPELPDLLGLEFLHRSARTIAEEYLERHSHPPLRCCVRLRLEERRITKVPPRKRIVPRPRPKRPRPNPPAN